MSSLFIRREAEHPNFPKDPKKSARGLPLVEHPIQNHLTLLPNQESSLELPEIARLLANAPDSIHESLRVRVARAAIVGHRATRASVALMIEDFDNTLRAEHDYFNQQTANSNYRFSPHITLARNLDKARAHEIRDRYDQKLSGQLITVHPASVFLGESRQGKRVA